MLIWLNRENATTDILIEIIIHEVKRWMLRETIPIGYKPTIVNSGKLREKEGLHPAMDLNGLDEWMGGWIDGQS